MCGLEVHLDAEDHVKVIRPDRDDVWSNGFICPKGTTLGRLHEDPDRIRVPMIREGSPDDPQWRQATWDEAFARCEELLHGVLDEHGIEAMTAFIGNPAGHSFSLSRYGALLMGQAGFPMIYSAGTVDQWPKNVSSVLMYGNMWKIPTVDIAHTDLWIIMGGNPQASGGSLLASPDQLAQIDGIKARGGQVIVIDPRRTITADHASEWIPIVPGTDAALLLAMANVIFAEGLHSLGAVDGLVEGVEAVREACASYTPERVEAFCKVPAATIRRLARALAGARAGGLYGRIGLCNQEFGTLASWMVDVVNIIAGQFDKQGGMLFGTPAGEPFVWKLDTALTGAPEFGRWRSRGPRAGAVLVPRRGDRHSGRRPDPRAHQHRRQSGAQRARFTASRGLAAAARLHDRHRLLHERDHAVRPCDPAGALAARIATFRRTHVGLVDRHRLEVERSTLRHP